MKSFTAKFIIRSIVVILVVFLTIYFLFNWVADEFINDSVEAALELDIKNNAAESAAILGPRGWGEEDLDILTLHFLDLPADTMPADSLALALLTDTISENYIIINERGAIVTSANVLIGGTDWLNHRNGRIDKRIFLTEYFQQNRNLFEIGETITVYSEDRIFFLRSVSTYYTQGDEFPFPPTPLTILLYAEVTDIMAFRNSINQILTIGLSLAGIIILGVTFIMSSQFNQSIKKLSDYAGELGHGKFDAEIESLRYSEFQKLARSMTDMSNMLATYEVYQKQFFQNASHELRTPLMAVQCYSEGILADVFEPKEASTIINSEIEKMTELVGSILYLSRINHHTFQLEKISINEFLTDCYDQIKVLANNNNIDLQLNPLDQDLLIHVDISLLERAVLNILSNALRYAQSEIIISLDTYINRNIFANIRQDMIRISITNDGEHIDEQDLPHLFERFYKGKGGNTGLGLAITKEIVLALDGQITVENRENGVCFTFTLPIYENKEMALL